MGRMLDTRRRRRQDRQRRSIIDAAARVLHRDGYAKLSMVSIAAEASLSKGGVFYYFKNKQAILTGIVERFEERVFGGIDEDLASGADAAFAVCRKLFERVRLELPRLSELLVIPELRPRVQGMRRRVYTSLTSHCRHPAKVAFLLYALEGMTIDRAFAVPAVPAEHMEGVTAELMLYFDAMAGDFY